MINKHPINNSGIPGVTQATGKHGEVSLLMRDLMLALSCLIMSLFLLMHFILVWMFDKVSIYEPSRWILALEIASVACILIFSLCCFTVFIKKTLRFKGDRNNVK